jgi:DNA-binding MarR family transcriptional regulator
MPIKFSSDDPLFNSWNLIHQTYDSILQCEEKICATYGITAKKLATLRAIEILPNPVTQKDLAECFDRDAASVTFIIDRMGKDGLVARTRDLKDRRSTRLIITPKGNEILSQAVRENKELYEKIMKNFSVRDLATLNALMGKIQDKTYKYRKVKNLVKEIKIPNTPQN